MIKGTAGLGLLLIAGLALWGLSKAKAVAAWQCAACGNPFASYNELKAHFASAHPDQPALPAEAPIVTATAALEAGMTFGAVKEQVQIDAASRGVTLADQAVLIEEANKALQNETGVYVTPTSGMSREVFLSSRFAEDIPLDRRQEELIASLEGGWLKIKTELGVTREEAKAIAVQRALPASQTLENALAAFEAPPPVVTAEAEVAAAVEVAEVAAAVAQGSVPVDFTASKDQLDALANAGYTKESSTYKKAVDNSYTKTASQTKSGETVAWSSSKGYYNISKADIPRGR